jgi:hypothetical protein
LGAEEFPLLRHLYEVAGQAVIDALGSALRAVAPDGAGVSRSSARWTCPGSGASAAGPTRRTPRRPSSYGRSAARAASDGVRAAASSERPMMLKRWFVPPWRGQMMICAPAAVDPPLTSITSLAYSLRMWR